MKMQWHNIEQKLSAPPEKFVIASCLCVNAMLSGTAIRQLVLCDMKNARHGIQD